MIEPKKDIDNGKETEKGKIIEEKWLEENEYVDSLAFPKPRIERFVRPSVLDKIQSFMRDRNRDREIASERETERERGLLMGLSHT